MTTRKNKKSNKSNKRFRKTRSKKQRGNGGVSSSGEKERDNNICIVYITTHGEIQNNDIRTIEKEEYSDLDIKKINAVDMNVCNYVIGKQSIRIGGILEHYHKRWIMNPKDEYEQSIEFQKQVIQGILKKEDKAYNNAIGFRKTDSIIGEKEDYDNFINNATRAYQIYDINGGSTYYNRKFIYKSGVGQEFDPFKTKNEFDILLIENEKTSSLLPILGKYDNDSLPLNFMNRKVYLNEIIEYLYKELRKNRIIIVDMSCANIEDEYNMTERGVRGIRRNATQEKIAYGGKRNTKKKIKRRKHIDIK